MVAELVATGETNRNSVFMWKVLGAVAGIGQQADTP
jgi:hypothetical protein